jgi:hypothetical protein
MGEGNSRRCVCRGGRCRRLPQRYLLISAHVVDTDAAVAIVTPQGIIRILAGRSLLQT